MAGWRRLITMGGVALLFVSIPTIVLPYFMGTSYVADPLFTATSTPIVERWTAKHLETPEPLKALYMTACVAGTPSWRESLKKLIEETELNSVMIDIKDSTGVVSFTNSVWPASNGRGCVVPDLREFIEELHESDIYVMGRISVFQDPHYAELHPELAVKSVKTGGVWKDRKGLSFIDVGAKPYWDKIVELSLASYELGFDEINYDYIRYPTDGDMKDTAYSWTVGTSTKPEMLENFFNYLHSEMQGSGAVLSADLFGMTTTVTSDMGIGQVLERALPYFDYIAPMVYPSHYPKNWNGFTNPAERPYDVIKIAMAGGMEREQAWNISEGRATSTPSKLRPWLQDFSLGATYDDEKVRAQIQATYDVGLTSWMLWSAGNKYTRGALVED